MTLDVFLTTTGRRPDLFTRVHAWWQRQEGIRLMVQWMPGLDRWHDQRQRRTLAEAMAHGALYVLTDDDILPTSPHFLSALALPLSDDRIGIASAYLTNENIVKQEAAGADPFPEFRSMLDVGGCRMIRRGVVTDLPPRSDERAGYDRVQCEAFRAKGYLVGYALDAHALHLGKDRSEMWS